MGFNLRNAILANVANSSEADIMATISDAMQNGAEKMLPGLGVLFEVYWQQVNENDKERIVATITQGLQR